MRNRKPKAPWVRVKRGQWTWLDYTVTLRWAYDPLYDRTHYWAWFVSVDGEEYDHKFAAAWAAKAAAEENYEQRVQYWAR